MLVLSRKVVEDGFQQVGVAACGDGVKEAAADHLAAVGDPRCFQDGQRTGVAEGAG
jgi:hypothetical protein